LRSAAWAAAGNDRVSSSVIPGAYDTITPFAYRSDNFGTYGRARPGETSCRTAVPGSLLKTEVQLLPRPLSAF
jgi:hypothetical protein